MIKKIDILFRLVKYIFMTLARTSLLLISQTVKSQMPPMDVKHSTFDVVCISHVLWSNIWQRNHHTMHYLSKNHKVIYCTPQPIWFPGIKNLKNIFKLETSQNYNSLSILQPHILPGERRFRFLKKINKLILVAHIKDMIIKMNMKNIVIWFYFPMHEYLIGSFNEVITVYDIQDEYATVEYAAINEEKPIRVMQSRRNELQSQEIELLKNIRLVFTGTYALYRIKKMYNSNIHFIPCGVDIEHFKKSRTGFLPLPIDIKSIPHPIIGYFGLICARVNSELLNSMASLHQEWSIVLVGKHIERLCVLEKLSNIYLLGEKDYKDLPSYVQAFDVCMIPFRLNDLTRKVNPTKLLEYLTAGKPVISTPLPDVIKFYSDVVEIAENDDEFIRSTEKLIRQGTSQRVLKGIEMAEGNSWDRTIKRMEQWISSNIKGA